MGSGLQTRPYCQCAESRGVPAQKPAGDVGTSAGYAVLEVDGNEGLHRQSW